MTDESKSDASFDQNSEHAGSGDARPGVLRPFERALLEWIVVWAPYGGAPEDLTFPEFGLSTTEVINRGRRIARRRLANRSSMVRDDRILVERVWRALQDKADRSSPSAPNHVYPVGA